MNPHNNEIPRNPNGIQLPSPVSEQAPAVGAAGETVQGGLEQQPATGMEQGRGHAAPALPALPAMPVIPLPAQSSGGASDVTGTTNSATSAIADDGDLIEKEWVEKAKAIVDRNRDDPYKQSEELTVFKADYMKKRYNKTIKLNK